MRVTTGSFSEAFGRFVQQKRRSAGMTQVEYASRMGISESRLSQIERGAVPPEPRLLEMIRKLGDDLAEWLRAAGYSEGGAPLGPEVSEVPEVLGEEVISRAQRFSVASGRVGEYGLVRTRGDALWPNEDMETVVLVVEQTLGEFRTGDKLLVHRKDTPTKGSYIIIKENPSGMLRLVRFQAWEKDNLLVEPLEALGLSDPVAVAGEVHGVVSDLLRRLSR